MSTRSKHLAVLAAVSILAACGGGGGTEGASTPQAVVTALRTQVDALRNVAPAEAARQLMDFGESRFPNYFPTHEPTGSEPPFAYRYYPQTGAYLGVVLTAGSGYVMNGVYVMGGPFGAAPQLVGLLSDFITPVDTSTISSNGCFDLALAQTEGTRIVANYSVTGSMTGTMQIDTLVGGLTTFGTQQARLTTVATTGSGTTADGSATINNSMKLYSSPTAATGAITQYGQEFVTIAQSMGFTITTTNRTVWNPPYADPQYTLALGASATSTLSGVLTSTMSGIPGLPSTPTTTTISQTSTSKYVGREMITVPAGTFETCHFEVTTPAGSTSTVGNWVIAGKGIPVRTIATDQTTNATSITVNGAAL